MRQAADDANDQANFRHGVRVLAAFVWVLVAAPVLAGSVPFVVLVAASLALGIALIIWERR